MCTWQGEAKLLESELEAAQEECNEIKRKAEEAELLVCSKDEKIGSLVLMLQEAMESQKEKEREKEEMKKSLLEAMRNNAETPSKNKADSIDLTTPSSSMPPPIISSTTATSTNTDTGNGASIEDSDSFWTNDRYTPDSMKSPGSAKSGASSSLAKRVLITWDRTQGGKGRAKVAKVPGSVSSTAFLMMVSE